jgi:hypothetical protein
VIDEEPTLAIPRLTRRDLRLQRRSHPIQRLVGWLGYAVSVMVVVAVASLLAVQSDTTPVRAPSTADVTHATTPPTSGVETVASTSPQVTAPTAPAPAATASTSTTAPSTTTTTVPIVAAAVAPSP